MTSSMPLPKLDVARLCNPYTGEPLRLEQGFLISVSSGQRFPIRDGIPSFLTGARLSPRARLVRWLYDRVAFAYDFTLRLGPKLRYGTEEYVRQEVVAALPIQKGDIVLETAAGTALNLPYTPKGTHYHALDISWNMLRKARRNLAGWRRAACLYHADAQFLPFHDNTFDHVFQMGGLQFIHDPFKSVSEMARVSKPGAQITILDEALGARKTFKRMPAHREFATDRASAIQALPRLVPRGMELLQAGRLPSGEFYRLVFRKPG